jgi:uncharacterized protein
MASLYDISFPIVAQGLQSLQQIIKVAEAHASKNGTSPDAYLDYRICDDMLPLRAQFAITVGTSKRIIERLTGTAPPASDFKEKSWAEVSALVDDALKLVQGVKKEDLVDPSTEVPCMYGPKTYRTTALAYLPGYAMPTFYFHIVTAYDILRMQGVPLGKSDYISPFMSEFTLV